MKHSCSKTSWILIILVLILLSLPALTGLYVRHGVMEKLLTTTWPQGYTVKLLQYKQGWFASKAQLQISPKTSTNSKFAEYKTINVNIRIFNGPLTYTKDLQGNKHWFYGLGVVRGTSTLASMPIRMYANIFFNKDISAVLENTGYQLNDAKLNFNIKIGSINSNINLLGKFTRVVGTTAVNQFTIGDAEMQFSMPQMNSNFTLTKDASGVWVGTRGTSIPLIMVSNLGVNTVSISNILFSMQSLMNQNLVNVNLNMSVQNILLRSNYNIGPVTLTYALNNLSAKDLNALQNFIADNNLDVVQDKQLLQDKMLGYTIALLQGTSHKISNFVIRTPSGDVQFTAQLNLPQQNFNLNTNMNTIALNGVLMQMILGSNADVNFSMPQQVVLDIMREFPAEEQQQVMTVLTQLQKAGAIQSNNNLFGIRFAYQNGNAELNGQPFTQVMMQVKEIFQNAAQNTGDAANTSVPGTQNVPVNTQQQPTQELQQPVKVIPPMNPGPVIVPSKK